MYMIWEEEEEVDADDDVDDDKLTRPSASLVFGQIL